MWRRVVAVVAMALAIVTPLTLSVGSAEAAPDCTVTGKIPTRDSYDRMSAQFAINCTANQAWTVDATVQASDNGSGWVRAAWTQVVTVSGNGDDDSVVRSVELSGFQCNPNKVYRTHAVYRNGSGGQADNSDSKYMCFS